MHLDVGTAEAALLVGSEWATGLICWNWRVMEAAGKWVRVVRVHPSSGRVLDDDDGPHGGHWWRYESLTQTTARRVYRAA